MHKARFFVNQELRCGLKICLVDDVVQHFFAFRILLKDTVILFNGDGNNYYCSVDNLDRKLVELEVLSMVFNDTELKTKISLFMSIIQRDNFELAVRKAVELGVYDITPVITAFSQKLNKYKIHDRICRWQKIAVSAAEQSGRSLIVKVHNPIEIEAMILKYTEINKNHDCLNLFCNVGSGVNLLRMDLDTSHSINLAIGPEGGFSALELDLFNQSQWEPVSLGHTVLRAETAAIVAVGGLSLKLQ